MCWSAYFGANLLEIIISINKPITALNVVSTLWHSDACLLIQYVIDFLCLDFLSNKLKFEISAAIMQ